MYLSGLMNSAAISISQVVENFGKVPRCMIQRAHTVRRERVDAHAGARGLDHRADLAIDGAIDRFDSVGESVAVVWIMQRMGSVQVMPEEVAGAMRSCEDGCENVPVLLGDKSAEQFAVRVHAGKQTAAQFFFGFV